ncbi:hypothetical protein ACFL6I_24480 [candidate division KSB1 bacterium]
MGMHKKTSSLERGRLDKGAIWGNDESARKRREQQRLEDNRKFRAEERAMLMMHKKEMKMLLSDKHKSRGITSDFTNINQESLFTRAIVAGMLVGMSEEGLKSQDTTWQTKSANNLVIWRAELENITKEFERRSKLADAKKSGNV